MEWGIKLGFIAVAMLIIIGIIWDSRRHRVRNKRHYREPMISTTTTDTDHGWDDVVIVKRQAHRPGTSTAEDREAEMLKKVERTPEEVISLSVMAFAGQHFHGRDIEQVATDLNLILGDRDIFHRNENHDGTGSKLFSMASAVKPGTFSLDTIDDFTTPGLALFLMQTLPGKSMVAFEMMVRTARQLAQALGGELWDDQRQVLTPETLERYRERIKAISQRRVVA